MIQWEPSWHEIWTIPIAEREMKDFKYNGPGWYFSKNDSMLVLPNFRDESKIWDVDYQPDELFNFYVWNQPNAPKYFEMIFNAPRR